MTDTTTGTMTGGVTGTDRIEKLREVESGFDQIPLGRRNEAYRMNDEGWAGQLKNIERHVARAQ